MYDELNMDDAYNFGIYVDDDRKTWYDEDTRKDNPNIKVKEISKELQYVPPCERFTNKPTKHVQVLEPPLKQHLEQPIMPPEQKDIDIHIKILLLFALICFVMLMFELSSIKTQTRLNGELIKLILHNKQPVS